MFGIKLKKATLKKRAENGEEDMHRTCAPDHMPKDLCIRVCNTTQELNVGVKVRVVSILSVMLKKNLDG